MVCDPLPQRGRCWFVVEVVSPKNIPLSSGPISSANVQTGRVVVGEVLAEVEGEVDGLDVGELEAEEVADVDGDVLGLVLMVVRRTSVLITKDPEPKAAPSITMRKDSPSSAKNTTREKRSWSDASSLQITSCEKQPVPFTGKL